MKPSEIATRELRAGLAYILCRIERREAAELPPAPDVSPDEHWDARRKFNGKST